MNTITQTPTTVNPPQAVILRFQGQLIEARVINPKKAQEGAVGARRGKITELSLRSRVRMIKKAARVNFIEKKTSFITLTYPHDYPSDAQAKIDLFTFLKAIRRYCIKKGYKSSGFWRMEKQTRGAPHFHLLLYNVPFIDKEKIQSLWNRIVQGGESPSTRIEAVRSRRGAAHYMSKYVAKVEQSLGGFIYMPYLTARLLTKFQKRSFHAVLLAAWVFILSMDACNTESDDCGRHWGTWMEADLPYAFEVTHILVGSDLSKFYAFRRLASRRNRHVKRIEGRGWFMLSDFTNVWREAVFDVLLESRDTSRKYWQSTGLEFDVPLLNLA